LKCSYSLIYKAKDIKIMSFAMHATADRNVNFVKHVVFIETIFFHRPI
jgi:hypothetical protein